MLQGIRCRSLGEVKPRRALGRNGKRHRAPNVDHKERMSRLSQPGGPEVQHLNEIGRIRRLPSNLRPRWVEVRCNEAAAGLAPIIPEALGPKEALDRGTLQVGLEI